METPPENGARVRLTRDAAQQLEGLGYSGCGRAGTWLGYGAVVGHLFPDNHSLGFILLRPDKEAWLRECVQKCQTQGDFMAFLKVAAQQRVAIGAAFYQTEAALPPTRRGRRHKMRVPAMPLEVE